MIYGKAYQPIARPRSVPPNYLTTLEFARAIDRSVSLVSKLLKAGKLRPEMKTGSGRTACNWFTPQQVAEFKAGLTTQQEYAKAYGLTALGVDPRSTDAPTPRRSAFTGIEAQKCFVAFEEGKSIRECVKAFGIHPNVVAVIKDAWAQTDGEVTLSRRQLDLIAELPLNGPLPIKTADDLIEVLRLAADDHTCTRCHKKRGKVCQGCSLIEARRVAEKALETFAQKTGLPTNTDAPPPDSAPVVETPTYVNGNGAAYQGPVSDEDFKSLEVDP